jgi:sulfite exporter TauE/SafE
MDELELPTRLAALFVTGLLSSGHCVGMCGGIAGGLTLRFPGAAAAPAALRAMAHNLGRIATYALLGALSGFAGGVLGSQLPVAAAERGARLFAAFCFAGVALFLLGGPTWLAPLERAGARLFRKLEPLRRRFATGGALSSTFLLGLTWGLLPCGLVYSASAVAATSGSAPEGALSMAAFGLGTLPALVAAGFVSNRLSRFARSAAPRRVAAALYLVAAFALVRSVIASPGDAAAGAPACHPAPPAIPGLTSPDRPAGS